MNVLLVAFAIYGIATIASDYDGPYMVFTRLRGSRIGKLFGCSVCLLPWLALIFSVLFGLDLLEASAALGIAVILARNV